MDVMATDSTELRSHYTELPAARVSDKVLSSSVSPPYFPAQIESVYEMRQYGNGAAHALEEGTFSKRTVVILCIA